MISAQIAVLCLVIGISDGDTLKVRCGSPGQYEEVKIRLAEVDAPEKAQPYGQRSKQSLSDLCYGKQAEIVVQGKSYDRRVAHVSCGGRDAVQAEAKAARRGLWADNNPIQPWEWRKKRR